MLGVTVLSETQIRVRNDTGLDLAGNFSLRHPAADGSVVELPVGYGWSGVSLSPGASADLTIVSPVCDGAAISYLLIFHGTLGLDPDAEVAVPFAVQRAPRTLTVCKMGDGTATVHVRVDGNDVGDLAIPVNEGCPSLPVPGTGSAEVTLTLTESSYVEQSFTLPSECDFPGTCSLAASASGHLAMVVGLGAGPLASLEVTSGTHECNPDGLCDSPFVTTSRQVSLIVGQRGYQYPTGPFVADQTTVVAAVDTSQAPLPFTLPKAPVYPRSYFIKVCPACLAPERREVLRVKGMIHGQPVDEEWANASVLPSCDSPDTDGCGYFKVSTGDPLLGGEGSPEIYREFCRSYVCLDGPQGWCR